jgi:mannan endo-1,4-beta-mannosidase
VAFDEDYFRGVQWAHLAAGGAGGGFRWPYRHPHSLTAGMRVAQRILSGLAAHVDWQHFDRRPLSDQLKVAPGTVKALACGNAGQVLLWLTRTGPVSPGPEPNPLPVTLFVPFLQAGTYRLRTWNTRNGQPEYEAHQALTAQKGFSLQLLLRGSDVVVLITRVSGSGLSPDAIRAALPNNE